MCVNDVPEWSMFEALSFMWALYMYVFISKFQNIVQAYLHSIYNLAVTFTLTPALQKDEK